MGGPPSKWLRGLCSAIRTVLAATLLGCVAPASGQDPQPREVVVGVGSGEDWAASGIEVRPGDGISIEASPAPARPAPLSPDGVAEVESENVLIAGLPYAALIGRIGDGPPFLVGTRYEARMTAAGPLQLRWNMIDRPYANSIEVFKVVLHYRPAPKPDPDKKDVKPVVTEKRSGDGSPADNSSVEANSSTPPSPPRRIRRPAGPVRDVVPPRPAGLSGAATPRLLGGIVLLLAAAVAAGWTIRRVRRTRRIQRTRALLSLSTSLDLGGGVAGPADDVPAEGPPASLRARIEAGVARMSEGSEHG